MALKKNKKDVQNKVVESDFTFEPCDNVVIDLYQKDNGKINAKITFCNKFVLFAKVIVSNGKAFLSYPCWKNKKGEYINYAYCFDKETIETINNVLTKECC